MGYPGLFFRYAWRWRCIYLSVLNSFSGNSFLPALFLMRSSRCFIHQLILKYQSILIKLLICGYSWFPLTSITSVSISTLSYCLLHRQCLTIFASLVHLLCHQDSAGTVRHFCCTTTFVFFPCITI